MEKVAQRAIGDDGIDWDLEAERASREDHPFTDPSALDYFSPYLPPRSRVLDLGCNIAKWFPLFKAMGAVYEGLDFSNVALRIAREKYPGTQFHYMKAEEMEFAERFDLVFCHTLLQHTSVQAKKRIVPRVWTALKPKGFFVIQEKSDVETATTFTTERWIRFITGHGFRLVTLTDPSYNPEKDTRHGYLFQKDYSKQKRGKEA